MMLSMPHRHSQDLKHLEDRLEETGRSKKWLTIFQLDLDPLRTDLKALRERVLVNQQRTTKSSKQIQDELRGIGIVTMPMEESSAFASTTSARTGAESLDTAASTQSSPAEVQIFKLIAEDLPNENNTIGSNTSGVPICRVGSTESWYVGEMKGAIPLKKWKKQISDVLAANSPSPPIS
ncbi:hypothetical protein D9757_008916 [Collybiopsis confluens]|uniref:Uncharacterized protein n=1 Tax=Collybiopsis confluens TaxID=2823264 RepID=A0A8H5H5L3_9AGAR|nr:hypothetical protein D9757_008916 [Collybiopsis confluens]